MKILSCYLIFVFGYYTFIYGNTIDTLHIKGDSISQNATLKKEENIALKSYTQFPDLDKKFPVSETFMIIK